MRNYTSIDRNRFQVFNIFRSLRFDIDRLDLDVIRVKEVPDMARGFRVTDHDSDEFYLVSGQSADDLIFSLAYIHSNNTGDYMYKFDEYLSQAIQTDVYLITNQESKDLKKTSHLH